MDVPQPKKKLLVISLLALVLVVGIGAAYLVITKSETVKAPSAITSKLKFPIYLPQKLPGVYKIDGESFRIYEETVIFQAKDSANGTIVFTEQAKEPGLDFANIYATQMKDAKTLNDTPFPSVAGKSMDGKKAALSVVTDETWVFVTTQSPVDDAGMLRIAQSMTRQKD
jgi:hypothetical protein